MQTKKLAKGCGKPLNLRAIIAKSRWETAKSLADHIGIHVNTLYGAIRDKRLPKQRLAADAVRQALGIK